MIGWFNLSLETHRNSEVLGGNSKDTTSTYELKNGISSEACLCGLYGAESAFGATFSNHRDSLLGIWTCPVVGPSLLAATPKWSPSSVSNSAWQHRRDDSSVV